MNKKVEPFIKWVGGKRQLREIIKNSMPLEFNNYFEPFIGGGAIYYEICSLYRDKIKYINDFNPELTNLYSVIKNNHRELIKELNKFQKKINSEDYYMIRGWDRDEEKFSSLNNITRAARFIYLNKTCYNGLYRVNQKGQNNVPFGKNLKAKLYSEQNIINASKYLKDTVITTGDFENIKDKIEKGDFIYLDPPYIPLNKTSNFTAYTNCKADREFQKRLKIFCDYVDGKGAFFLASNSSAQEVFKLYENYNIKTVDAKRSINSDGNKRGNVKEVLISNY